MSGSPGDVGEVHVELVKQRKGYRLSCGVGEVMEGLNNELCLILQPLLASPTSQLILQPFHHFTYTTAHSTTLSSLHLHNSSFYNPSITSPTSQLILLPFHHVTYVTAHSTTLPSLHLHNSSFYNPSITSPTQQLILQPFRCFTYVTGTSPTSPDEPPMINRVTHAVSF